MVTSCQHRASFSWPEKKSSGHPNIPRGCAIVREAICRCMQKPKFGQRMRPMMIVMMTMMQRETCGHSHLRVGASLFCPVP